MSIDWSVVDAERDAAERWRDRSMIGFASVLVFTVLFFVTNNGLFLALELGALVVQLVCLGFAIPHYHRWSKALDG